MKTILLSAILISLFASVVLASAVSEVATVVSTSRALRVAFVRNVDDNAPWYVF